MSIDMLRNVSRINDTTTSMVGLFFGSASQQLVISVFKAGGQSRAALMSGRLPFIIFIAKATGLPTESWNGIWQANNSQLCKHDQLEKRFTGKFRHRRDANAQNDSETIHIHFLIVGSVVIPNLRR
jgi:hypothetical protein